MQKFIERHGRIDFSETSENETELLPGWEAYVNVRTEGPTFLVSFKKRTEAWAATIVLSTMNNDVEWHVENLATGDKTTSKPERSHRAMKEELDKMLATIAAIEAGNTRTA